MITMKLNDKQFKTAMKKLEREIKSPKKFLQTVGENEQKMAEERLKSKKTNPDGRAWAPWAYSTIVQRQREGNIGRGMLYRTGNMLKSFYHKVSRQAVEIRNSAFYARYIQVGTAQMPRREFLGWGKESMGSLTKTAKRHFGRIWR